jgi:hypothetical protein
MFRDAQRQSKDTSFEHGTGSADLLNRRLRLATRKSRLQRQREVAPRPLASQWKYTALVGQKSPKGNCCS